MQPTIDEQHHDQDWGSVLDAAGLLPDTANSACTQRWTSAVPRKLRDVGILFLVFPSSAGAMSRSHPSKSSRARFLFRTALRRCSPASPPSPRFFMMSPADSDPNRSPSDDEKTIGAQHFEAALHELPPDPDAHLSEEERAAIVRKPVARCGHESH